MEALTDRPIGIFMKSTKHNPKNCDLFVQQKVLFVGCGPKIYSFLSMCIEGYTYYKCPTFILSHKKDYELETNDFHLTLDING